MILFLKVLDPSVVYPHAPHCQESLLFCKLQPFLTLIFWTHYIWRSANLMYLFFGVTYPTFCLFLMSFYEIWAPKTVCRLPRWRSGKASICQCRRCKRCGFDPWVRKIPWSTKCQPTPGFLPGESHGQRSLADYSLWGHKELDTTKRLSTRVQSP